jgi:acetyltransferase-like isoleucine patch superfamily enzyme
MHAAKRHLRALLRRTRSASVLAANRLRSWLARLVAHWFQDGITIGERVWFGGQVILSATDGGTISIGNGVGLGRTSRIVAREGNICIDDQVFLGEGCIVVSLASIDIGAGTQIAEYVVIRDQDHDPSKRPFASENFQAAPIVIGRDCWIGAKATILRGSRIGDGAVIGAHSVVRGDIPPNTLAVGAPARVVKTLPSGPRKLDQVLTREACDVAV